MIYAVALQSRGAHVAGPLGVLALRALAGAAIAAALSECARRRCAHSRVSAQVYETLMQQAGFGRRFSLL